MIYFNINIRNPFWWERFENLWTKHGDTPWKHKHWEAQFMKDCELFRIEFNWTTREDHAGVKLELGLLGYKLALSFYDSRHWDWKNNCWTNYNELEDLHSKNPTGEK